MSIIAELIENITPLLGGIGTIFWIWMLIDCLSRAKARPQRGWLFVLIFFTHWIGALVYFFTFVYPLSRLFRSAPQPLQSAPQRPFIYYTPPPKPTNKSYQNYEQGYQPRSVPMPTPPPTYVASSQEDLSQTIYTSSSDYEEPQSTYPEMPPQ